jgi:class 3 adenylate cyclase
MADPGDVFLSGSVYDQVKCKLGFGFDELGLRTIKNIAEPVPVYRIGASSQWEAGGPGENAPLPLPAFRSRT